MRHPAEKDETDLELALLWAVEQGANWLRMIGATGGRIDQTMSNIYLLALPILDGCDVKLVAGKQALWLARPGETRIGGAVGDTISLIPLNGTVRGVRTENLYYPLKDEDLYFGPARGVSNVMTAEEAAGLRARRCAAGRAYGWARMTTTGRSTTIKLVKCNHRGEKVLEYSGEVVMRDETWVCVMARYNNPDKDAGYVVFRRNDTFIEWHYSDRWYNVFELYDVDDGHLKGWYCNITRPAILDDDTICADDLALDVFVSPKREVLVLDEDEFAALDLPPEEQRAAWAAVEAIRRTVTAHKTPFG